MSKDKQREAFEAWYGENYSQHALKTWREWKYDNLDVELAWQAWQAAKQAQWLPIESNKPPCNESAIEYLVFDTLNNKVGHDYWMVPDDGSEPFWNHYGKYVSHWMPLPLGPNK